MAYDPHTCYRELGRALSRYNGYTNYPKLERIADIIAGDDEGDLFAGKPYRYAHEVIEKFMSRGKKDKQRSAEVYLQHAIAFGFLYRAVPGSARLHTQSMRRGRAAPARMVPGGARLRAQSKKRVESNSHIALSSLGRAYRSAAALPDEEGVAFRRWLWEYVLLDADFDMYGLLLKLSLANNAKFIERKPFEDAYKSMEIKRNEWLKGCIPSPAVRERVESHIQWKVPKDSPRVRNQTDNSIRELNSTTCGYHHSQRKGWARGNVLQHADSAGRLTEYGMRFARLLPPLDARPLFWIGPHFECTNSLFLKVAGIPREQCSPVWDWLTQASHPDGEHRNEYDEAFVDAVANHMKRGYPYLRLAMFDQAALDTVLPYIHFLAHQRKIDLDKDAVHRILADVFKNHRATFVCTLGRNYPKTHFWLRTHSNGESKK